MSNEQAPEAEHKPIDTEAGCGCKGCDCHNIPAPKEDMIPRADDDDAEDLRNVRHHG